MAGSHERACHRTKNESHHWWVVCYSFRSTGDNNRPQVSRRKDTRARASSPPNRVPPNAHDPPLDKHQFIIFLANPQCSYFHELLMSVGLPPFISMPCSPVFTLRPLESVDPSAPTDVAGTSSIAARGRPRSRRPSRSDYDAGPGRRRMNR
jgi:hypothetical protein